ncbi:sensor histidine kinase RcsC [Lachnospiraceae bacterium]|nr:sensor histidine kinase RcsC [Lachnospiraceae bacterium]
MHFELSIGIIWMLISLTGVFIPLIGIFVLMGKEQSKSSMNLMIANIGCLIMNGAYFLLLRTDRTADATMALKMEYLGNFLFYFFFIKFILSYMQIDVRHKWVRIFTHLWMLFEVAVIAVVWDDTRREEMFAHHDLEVESQYGYHFFNMQGGIIYKVRYGFLLGVLLCLIAYMIIKRVHIRKQGGDEKHNLSHLIVAKFVIIIPLIMEIVFQFSFEFVPVFSSVAVLLIILSVVEGDIFSVLDIGRGWVIENFEAVFIIADSTYGYLDSNIYAKQQFEELEDIHKGEKFSLQLRELFLTEETQIVIGDKHYERFLKELVVKDKVRGYCLMLLDVTRNFNMMEALKEAKYRAEEANESKSNFLSNMSHEIRTPMNAIVGMTEILLRSDLSDQDRGYLMNIKNSGASLLTIINDILDFSKIESGRLEIIEEEYEPMSMLSDLSMIFLNRIGDKPVELIFDIDKNLPNKIYGDSLRIRQVIINIANNAIKFTEQGFVKLAIKMSQMMEPDMVNLEISIEDSGQGIKPEDLDKLFGSFQQVDTKKNRNKEGTGLGLAISKQLVENMGGQIGVRSEYGKGSEFYFNIPQRAIGDQVAAMVKEEAILHEPIVVSGHMNDKQILEQLKKLTEEYGLRYVDCYEAQKNKMKVDFFFVDELVYRGLKNSIEEYFVSTGTELCVLQNPMREAVWDEQATVVNKPLYTLNFCQVINHEMTAAFVETDNVMNFIAPQAQILIVDDNKMNLKVARGLLQPLQMKIDTASSGKTAIEMVQLKKYHIVFMDHMMPVMDGVETTQKIRELEDDYIQNMPIIALTANAVMGAREIFKQAGMNDFVPKPIELKNICSKIRTWLPKELIQKMSSPVLTKEHASVQELPAIEGLNVAEGIKNSGSLELFTNLLGDFYKLIDLKSTKIEKCLADGMIRDYTIEVHALKNTARMIGAMELSELFYKMEQCGNAEDMETITKENPAIMELYRSYKPILEPYGKANEQDKKEVPKDEIVRVLDKLNSAMDNFDLDGADAALVELEEYRLPETLSSYMEELRAYVADVAMEEVMNTGKRMIELLERSAE